MKIFVRRSATVSYWKVIKERPLNRSLYRSKRPVSVLPALGRVDCFRESFTSIAFKLAVSCNRIARIKASFNTAELVMCLLVITLWLSDTFG